MTENIQKMYMQGRCDAMAIALATHFEAKIVAIHPVHVRKDGVRRTDPDILHALVELPDGQYMDVCGIRTIPEMLNDLSGIVDLITLEEDVFIEFETRAYDTPYEFIEYANVDPSHSVQAYKDAQKILGELVAGEEIESVMNDLVELSSMKEESYGVGETGCSLGF
jgi:hypothetical protein